MREGYKSSGFGEVPFDWDIVNLDKLGVFNRGKGISKKELSNEGVPCVRYGEIYTVHHTIIRKYYSFIDRSLVNTTVKLKKNDILFAGSGETAEDIGKAVANITDDEVYAGGDIVIFSPQHVNSVYLAYCLNDNLVTSQRKKFGQGNSVVHIYARDLGKLLLLIPPLPEQQKIATILSTVDEKIEVINAQITQTRELKKGLMQKLLTRGIGHTKFQDSVLGEIPESWEVIKLGELVSKVGSGITPKGGQESYLSEGVIFIRSQNVLVNKLKLTDVAYISPYQHNKMSNSKIQPMDVLLNITGASIGRCCLVPSYIEEANVNQHVCVIRVNEKLNPVYLAQVLNSNFGSKQIDKFQAGGNREGLNFQQIRSFDIILPNIAEQQQVATILTTIDDKIDVLQTKKEGYQELKKGLMQQLLTGKVRVFQSELETA